MKKAILILSCLLFFSNIYSQIPLGKDVKKGKTELIAFMKSKGFTYMKDGLEQSLRYNYETKKHDIPADKYYSILFKEEITIYIYFNEYENINAVHVILNNRKNKEKFLKAIDFENKWEYKYTEESIAGKRLIYTKGNFRARIPSEVDDIIQINFSEI